MVRSALTWIVRDLAVEERHIECVDGTRAVEDRLAGFTVDSKVGEEDGVGRARAPTSQVSRRVGSAV